MAEDRLKIEFHASRGNTDEEQKILSRMGSNEPVKLAKDCVPEWYKTLPQNSNEGMTAKQCPGIFDFCRTGYILPMWCDMSFRVDDEDPKMFVYKLPPTYDGCEHFIVEHPAFQIKDAPFLDYGCQTILKLVTPWFVQVPKGVSLFYTIPFYSVNQEDYTVCTGVIDPEIERIANREINIFIKLNRRNGTIKLKKGNPILQIIPFIRSDYDFEIHAPELSELESLQTASRSNIHAGGDFDKGYLEDGFKKLNVNRMKDGKSFACPVKHT